MTTLRLFAATILIWAAVAVAFGQAAILPVGGDCRITQAVYTAAGGKLTTVPTRADTNGISLPAVAAKGPVTITVRTVAKPTLVLLRVVEFDPIDRRELPNTQTNHLLSGRKGELSGKVTLKPGKVYLITASPAVPARDASSHTVMLNVGNN